MKTKQLYAICKKPHVDECDIRDVVDEHTSVDEVTIFERGSVYSVREGFDPYYYAPLELEQCESGIRCTNHDLTLLQASQLSILVDCSILIKDRNGDFSNVIYPAIGRMIVADDLKDWENL